MTKKTPLYEDHISVGGKMVDFAGWSMPVNYGSQIAEHEAVRSTAGMFDVSHMTVIDVTGHGALDFLRHIIANDCGRLDEYGALYGAILNERGGVIDDLIVYRQTDGYRCVVNASTRDKVLDWFSRHCPENAEFEERELAMIAVQGPRALTLLAEALDVDASEVKPFSASVPQAHPGWLVGRTGYTGEDGVEIILPGEDSSAAWQKLAAAGVVPAGLGARDTLRLEAGLNLYGQDLDEDTSPLASNIGWTVAWEPEDRAFIGRDAIEAERGACPQKLTGLILRDKGVLRHGQEIATPAGDGVVTSGSFAPTMKCSVGLARVPAEARGEVDVLIRGKKKKATLVKPPFVRNGKILVS